jgi:hypothetical protein
MEYMQNSVKAGISKALTLHVGAVLPGPCRGSLTSQMTTNKALHAFKEAHAADSMPLTACQVRSHNTLFSPVLEALLRLHSWALLQPFGLNHSK